MSGAFFLLYGKELTMLVLGPQWSLAGDLLCYLSFLGFGTILKGLVNIVHINEEKAARLLLQHVLCLVLIYPPVIGVLFYFNLDIRMFTLVFSISTFLYWFASLLKTMHHFHPPARKVVSTGFYILLLTAVFCLSGIYLKSWFELVWFVEMFTVGFLATAASVGTLYLVFPNIIRQQYIFIRDRLPLPKFP